MDDGRRILLFFVLVAVMVVVYFGVILARLARGQDLPWVDQLTNGKAEICCSNNDGRRLIDPDWAIRGDHYEVRFPNEGWLAVPDAAVVRQTNKDGIARVWSVVKDGGREIRCFLPGALG